MGKSSFTSGPLIRAEQSGNLDGNESNRIFRLTYDHDEDDDNTISNGGSQGAPNDQNSETLITNAPLIIKEYKVTVAANDLVMLHQYYGDENVPFQWNTSMPDFHPALKQWVMCPGAKQKYMDNEGLNTLEHSNQYAVRTLHFDTDYIKRRGKKGYWKNGLRPIVLSKNRGKEFGFTVSNLSGNDNAFFYCVVEIKRWSILE